MTAAVPSLRPGAAPGSVATPRTWPVLVLVLLFFLGVGATLPALPAAVREAGAGGSALGLVLGVFPFAALAGRLVAGRATDRGGRVLTLRAGLVVTLVAGALFALPLPVEGLVARAGAARTGRRPRLHGGLGVGARPDARGPPSAGPVAARRRHLGRVRARPAGRRGARPARRRPGGAARPAWSACSSPRARRTPRSTGEPAPGLRALLPRGVALPGTALGLGNLGYAAMVGFLVVHLDDQGGRGAVALTAFSVAVLLGRLVVVPLAARLGILRTLPYGLVAMAAGLLRHRRHG